jgi:NADH:ubiquinone reductase (H+-translocating)
LPRDASSDRHRIVILGAGYGGITCALRLGRRLNAQIRAGGVEVLLIDRNPYHLLETRLHEAAARGAEVTIPIARLLQKRPVRFRQLEVSRIHHESRVVESEAGPVGYDTLVIALGSKSMDFGIPGMAEHAFKLKTLEDAQSLKAHIDARMAEALQEPDPVRRQELRRIVIGGAGITGVELATELAERMHHLVDAPVGTPNGGEVLLVEAGPRILPSHEEAIARRTQRVLDRERIQVSVGTRIVEVKPDAVLLSSDQLLRAGTIVWTGGVRASEVLEASDLPTTQQGRVVVGPTLAIQGIQHAYAIGDAAMARDPDTRDAVPMAAQFALQQGRLVADNLVAELTGKPPRPYQPKVLGEVISLGRHLATGWFALGWLGRLRMTGFLASLLKRAISERHLVSLWRESSRMARPE